MSNQKEKPCWELDMPCKDAHACWDGPCLFPSVVKRMESKKPTGPPHPGWVLRDKHLPTSGMSRTQLSLKMHVCRQTVHNLVNGHNGMTAPLAWKLATVFNTTPDYWMNLQTTFDLWLHKPEKHLNTKK
jgi:addiction module HigA family antidote